MTIDMAVVELSRLQFALTAMYHFLFVPLTLGLAFMLVIMETVYVITDRPIWRDITRFWGKVFGINFVLGVATGITMEFEFGTNWAYYSHYVGDVFGAPLAIEGLMAFFLEATFVGLMVFGWDKLSKRQHLLTTFLVALGTNLSAVWILVANGWMQNPTGSAFNPETMRMEVVDFMAVVFNPVAQAKFVHTVSAGYVLASVFVLGVSSWYLLKGRHLEFAKRSFAVAAAFGLAASLSVVVLGDESGYALTDNQKMKLAAIEGAWHTEPAPAGLSIFGIPSNEGRETKYEVKIPYVLGLISTRSLTGEVAGITPLVEQARVRIIRGIDAYDAVEKLKVDRTNLAAREQFERNKADLGYAMLLKRYVVAVPRDGGPRLLLHRVLRGRALLRQYAQVRPQMVSAHGIVGDPAAMGRDPGRLADRGDRASALGGRGRAADLPRRVQPHAQSGVGDDRRLHPDLWRARGDRGAADARRDQAWPREWRARSRADCSRRRAQPLPDRRGRMSRAGQGDQT